MNTPLIELRNVAMAFDDSHVLHDVSLRIEKNEAVVIIGPSGEGKSVVLKMIAGILPPTRGQVLIDGIDLYMAPESDRLEQARRMGMLFQKNALFDSLSVGENIAFPLRELTDLTESAIQDKIDFFLKAVGIPQAKKLFPDEISGGMQKRLGIARALALAPEIILYDDPTAGLDPITSRRIVELILQLKKENKSTVVAITNDMNRAYQMADRICMVCDGDVIVTGTIAETKKHKDPRVQQFIQGLLNGPLTAQA